jgi:hypothetical protein
MTDLEKFLALYESFGIKCSVFEDLENRQIVRLIVNNDPGRELEEGCTSSEKIDGYDRFYTDIVFDSSGKFICQIIME